MALFQNGRQVHPGGMAVMLAAYAAGMATVLMSVALGAALRYADRRTAV